MTSWPVNLLGRWFARPDTAESDERWAEDFVGWVDEMRLMEGTRTIRRPLPYPVERTSTGEIQARSA